MSRFSLRSPSPAPATPWRTSNHGGPCQETLSAPRRFPPHIIEGYQVPAPCWGHNHGLIERRPLHSTPSLEVAPRAGEIHQDSPHQLCRNREEVGAVLPAYLACINQPKVSFVD